MKVMVCNFARGGMRSVVEGYIQDGFVAAQDIVLLHSYVDGGFVRRQLALISAFGRFLWLLTSHKIELVHIHMAMRGSFWRKSLFAVSARLARARVILHLHGSEMRTFYNSQRPWVQRIISRQLERADCVLVLSESWRSFILNMAPRAKPTVVPNYITVPARRPKSLVKPRIDLLFLGALGHRKGIFDLLQAVRDIRQLCPSLHLTVGGDGELEKARKLASELQVSDAVTFLGWVDGAVKEALLRNADIFALPSYNEGLPVSLLEAMSNEVAIITTTVGGIPELVRQQVDGMLIAPGDVKSLGSGLSRLATDVAFRTALASSGYFRVKQLYSKDVILPRLELIYASLLQPADRRTPVTIN